MALSNAKILAAKSKAKPWKLYDERGLYVDVRPSGGKFWKLKYVYRTKEQLLTLGRYPDVSLKDARTAREAALEQLARGVDPSLEKKRTKAAELISAANTFDLVAQEFIEKRRAEGVRDTTHDKAVWFASLLEPSIGSRPIAEIEPVELLAAIKKIEKSGRRETARRLLAFAGRVFRYAIATARARHDIAGDLRGSLTAPQTKHLGAIIDEDGVGALLRAIDAYAGQPWTRLGLQLAAHVFLRPGEVRRAKWSEIDFEHAIWRVPVANAKMKREHVVPLSQQAISILREVRELGGRGDYVFPSIRTPLRPMSENTLNGALRRLGYTGEEMTSHGFRATASTLLNESGKWSTDAIERALAHGDKDKVRAAYHRGTHWSERVEMAQWWSDHLDSLRQGQSKPDIAASFNLAD